MAGLDGLDAERDAQMELPHPWRPEENHVLGALALDRSAASRPAPSEQEPFVVQIRQNEPPLDGEAVTLEAVVEQARARQPADRPVGLPEPACAVRTAR